MLPSFALALASGETSADALAHRLRTGEQPVVPRVEREQLLIDARTVLPGEDDALLSALRGALYG
jgi:L-seryl-tRNA(Ser) seleniumtransferase